LLIVTRAQILPCPSNVRYPDFAAGFPSCSPTSWWR